MGIQAATRERPIIFSGEMVRAILAGQKTQTRRVVQMDDVATVVGRNESGELDPDSPREIPEWQVERLIERCPHGQPGNRLWVKETWQDYCPLWDGGWCGHGTQEGIAKEHQPVYRADDESKWLRGPAGKEGTPLKWRSSLFMPHWASRITLEITGVRIERLQSITTGGYLTRSDVNREGCLFDYDPLSLGEDELRWFIDTWDSINGKKPGRSWNSNPFVWVIEFKRV